MFVNTSNAMAFAYYAPDVATFSTARNTEIGKVALVHALSPADPGHEWQGCVLTTSAALHELAQLQPTK
jgi:hypothetical protein